MEELFRFSVIRAATRSSAATVSLEAPATPPPTGAYGFPPSFQDQLRNIVQSLTGDNATAEAIWKSLEPIALEFVLSVAPGLLANSLWATLRALLDSLRQAIYSQTGSSSISTDISRAFQNIKVQPLPTFQLGLSNLLIALLVIRRGGPANLDNIIRSGKLWTQTELLSDKPTLQELADLIRVTELLKAGPASLAPPPGTKPTDIPAAIQAAFQTAMNKTLLFPPGIFAPLRKPVHGVGFRELHVVKQHIRRYECAEIGRIENILKGEGRTHSQKHTLSNERDTFIQTVSTTETDKELTSTDHVYIKNETQNQVKEDTKVDAGVHAQYDSGSFKLQADVTVSYDKSSDDTKKFSSDVAKDVTQKAVNKVTQQVTQSQTTKIIETFEEIEAQSFENKTGPNVSGVYQWVEKVYLAQVFNLGRHMLLDIMVPEPASALLAAAKIHPEDQTPPVPPASIDSLDPQNIDANQPSTYEGWIKTFQVTGVDPPPEHVTVSKAIAAAGSDYKENDIKYNDTIKIDDGYKASNVRLSVAFRPRDPKDGGDQAALFIQIGQKQFNFVTYTSAIGPTISTSIVGDRNRVGNLNNVPAGDLQLNWEGGTLPVTVWSVFTVEAVVNIEVECIPNPALLGKWQLQTYDKIVTAWQKLQSDYNSKVAALQFQKASLGPLGTADPEANRLTERIELKRACVAIIDNSNETVRGVTPNVAIQDSPHPSGGEPDNPYNLVLPEPILPYYLNLQGNKSTQQLGASVRWFEQAFEWENIAYVFYPYFWGRRQTWIDRLNLKNEDPLFLNFLQAGYARVVIPVRLGFEWAVHFYLHTGLPWLHQGLPPIGDKTQNPLYLDIAEEIKALTGGGESKETETPIGEPWEYVLPTTLIKLRKEDTLPEWNRVVPAASKNDPSYATNAPDGPWTWKDAPPKGGPC